MSGQYILLRFHKKKQSQRGEEGLIVLSNTQSDRQTGTWVVGVRAFLCCPHSWHRLSSDRWSGGLYGSIFPLLCQHPPIHTHARTHNHNNAGRVRQELTLQIYIMKHHSIVLVKATRHYTELCKSESYRQSLKQSSIKAPHNYLHTLSAPKWQQEMTDAFCF